MHGNFWTLVNIIAKFVRGGLKYDCLFSNITFSNVSQIESLNDKIKRENLRFSTEWKEEISTYVVYIGNYFLMRSLACRASRKI
jgi:hypothetical protein